MTPFNADSPFVDDVVVAANVEPRRGVAAPTMLVLHYTGMMNAAKAVEWLSVPHSKVSCHYLVDEAGRVTQMVPEALRAWHAGVSCWAGESDLNSASVGIEIHNPGHELGYWDFSEAQMLAVERLSRDIVVPTIGKGMATWREKLFAQMHHNASAAAEFLQLPSNAVVELGSKVEI